MVMGWMRVLGGVLGLGGTMAACGGAPPADGETEASTETEGPDPIGWFKVGWGDATFAELRDGDSIAVVWGGQGAAMFPLVLRGAQFTLPDPPEDYLSERAPILDLHIDIDGHNNDIGGHFRRLSNYPVAFKVLPDQTYEFVYLPIILPDGVEPITLDGLPAHLWAQLEPYGSAPLVFELDLVVDGDTTGS